MREEGGGRGEEEWGDKRRGEHGRRESGGGERGR